ncbi:MAG: hypothetical protein JRI23_32025 [Deltaproteobacteria bacterium]|jgi:hypothetical protein|nr:hypothetical protein [Deltaproteobacteria bacterium]MBW2536856.1 hypothetical protein [Deltaproteobacteria bacterium]
MRNLPVHLAAATVISLCPAATGCDDKPSQAASTATTTVTATAKPKPSVAAEPVPKPEPLDVERLKKNLRCAAKSTGGPCRILNDFTGCEPHKMVTPGGEGRWIGRAYRVEGTDFVEEYLLLRSRRVPLTEVGKGQIGAKIGVATLPEEETAAHRQARKAVNKLGRDDTPKSNNAAITYLKRKQDWSESYAMEAEQNQVYVVSAEGTYLCQLKDHQRLLLIQRSTSSKRPADGLYAELYPATW